MITGSTRRVFVGLSGGVDSSVAAALLQRQGYDVTGVFIKVWQPDFLECTWEQDRLDAMRVCATLEIPFTTYDLSDTYKRDVVDYMLREYEAGRTPNPDVMCNTHVKFDAFLRRALEDGADAIATGHYVRQVERRDAHALYTAADQNKDQSYFLWGLTQDVLQHTIFPIGAFTKDMVRDQAATFGLPTAAKRDSQGLCFLGKLDMREFLSHFIDSSEGSVLNEEGNVIGTHAGAVFYTIGQRHGFTTTDGRGAAYVIDKNLADNTIVVSRNPDRKAYAADATDVCISDTNWIAGTLPDVPLKASARSRYRQELVPCTVAKVSADSARIAFTDTKPLTPPGQSLVLYSAHEEKCGRELLGGGIIEAKSL